jgi:hypothetical protein
MEDKKTVETLSSPRILALSLVVLRVSAVFTS